MQYRIIEIEQGQGIWNALLEVAPSMDEAIVRQLTLEMDWTKSNHILVAMSDEQPVGVLRFVTQRLARHEACDCNARTARKGGDENASRDRGVPQRP